MTDPSIRLTRRSDGLIGDDPAIHRVRNLLQRAARVDSNVLILGESGTGKEVTARLIHRLSSRAQGPFVPINCGAIPSELLESELFGHERGSFTGAVAQRKGRFELAGDGTLLLDEIAEMSPDMQVKLLRVLQERSFERVGGQQPIALRARIVAATHQNLPRLIDEGKFRHDLYYRLNVLPVHLPPLRNRRDDIPLLIEATENELRGRGHLPAQLTPSAIELMRNYAWPGNIRQLKNIIERLCILHPEETVDVDQLPHEIQLAEDSQTSDAGTERPNFGPTQPILGDDFNLKEYLETVENDLIELAMAESDGVIAQAARKLGIRRTTLVEKLRRRAGPRPSSQQKGPPDKG